MSSDERLRLFARGELAGAELEAFEQALDESPTLRRELAEFVARPARGPLFEPEVTVRSDGLSLRRVLGRGGMATVMLATQHSLEREVAVKMSRRRDGQGAHDQLLREARLTGALEHPAIVPVHYLATSEEGELQVVLKRVEGEPWSALLRDRDAVQQRFGAELLEWNLRVLATVCSATAFAHERGVLHRDIKPANVMIGRFGEVLLMDWGIGGLLEEDPSGRLPHVVAGDGAGTPPYQAPETLPGARTPLSQRTDVYLLGAVLYELLFGRAPFAGVTHRSETDVPSFEGEVESPELVEVARRALSADPNARHASATEFLRAIEGCQRTQHASRLVRRAQQLLSRAREQRAAKSDAATRTANEASFALLTALELAADHEGARSIARALTTFQVECALEDGHPGVAAQVLDASPTPMPALRQQVEHAVEAQRQLQHYARAHDPGVGRDHRIRLLSAILVTSVGFYALRFAFPALASGRWALTIASLLFLVAIGGLAFAFRAALRASALSRQMVALALVVTLGQVAVRAAGAWLELSRAQVIAFELPLIAVALGTAALIHHWSMGVAALVLVTGQVLALWQPAFAERFFTGAVVVGLTLLVVIWRSGGWRSMTVRSPS
ncbi:MAG: serine/threonine protein kinase [Archangiaceae bacterium]|nr:serine/threonine protein kinase [Archangiaceae bacterium]